MAKRKKKKSKSKGTPLKGTSFAVGLVGGLILLGVVFFFFSSDHEVPYPAYEEISLLDSVLHRTIGRVDDILYEILYKNNIPEENIFFLAVRPMNQKIHEWDFTEIAIRLRDKGSLIQFGEKVCRELSQVGRSVECILEPSTQGEMHCRIRCLGLQTHKIQLLLTGGMKPPSGKTPKVSFIIDDLGYDDAVAKDFMALDLPLALSVLPIAPRTAPIVKEAKRKGRELMLHLPMEPKNYPYYDPGPGAILTTMGEREIATILAKHLEKVPGARGINNHMGSFFTERWDKMSIVMQEVKKRDLFFVDSRTTSNTVVVEVARKMGVPVARRNVFFDNDSSPKAIRVQMERLLGIARQEGSAIGIGHPNRNTLEVLNEFLPKLKRNFEVVPVSQVIH